MRATKSKLKEIKNRNIIYGIILCEIRMETNA